MVATLHTRQVRGGVAEDNCDAPRTIREHKRYDGVSSANRRVRNNPKNNLRILILKFVLHRAPRQRGARRTLQEFSQKQQPTKWKTPCLIGYLTMILEWKAPAPASKQYQLRLPCTFLADTDNHAPTKQKRCSAGKYQYGHESLQQCAISPHFMLLSFVTVIGSGI